MKDNKNKKIIWVICSLKRFREDFQWYEWDVQYVHISCMQDMYGKHFNQVYRPFDHDYIGKYWLNLEREAKLRITPYMPQ